MHGLELHEVILRMFLKVRWTVEDGVFYEEEFVKRVAEIAIVQVDCEVEIKPRGLLNRFGSSLSLSNPLVHSWSQLRQPFSLCEVKSIAGARHHYCGLA